MEKIKRKGVRYIRNMKHEDNSSYLTWQSTFETKSREVFKHSLSLCVATLLGLQYLDS